MNAGRNPQFSADAQPDVELVLRRLGLSGYASFVALHDSPSPTAGPIRLATDLSEEEVQQSAVARNATILLHAAATGPGLKTTAAGNLSRGVVTEMCDLFTWPDFDKAQSFRFQKAINEADFLPLFFVRNLVQAAGLVRKHKARIETSPAGRRMLERLHLRSLQAMLFHVAFWRLDLSYFGRGLLHGWPQRDAGLVRWSLSVAANDWQPRERLSRLCTVPVIGVLEQKWDIASYALEAHILRPLLWFGLLEYGSVAIFVLLTISAAACELEAAPFQPGHTSLASASSVD